MTSKAKNHTTYILYYTTYILLFLFFSQTDKLKFKEGLSFGKKYI